MSRRKRFYLPSATYHIMLRGNDGQRIFHSNKDRCRMSLLIQEGVERYGHEVHSFCLMSNHIHLAIQVGEINISRIIQNLSFRYSRYFNREQKRRGHLFQGRFKSVLVEGIEYLRELVRYIHLNPVRAGMVDQPEEYQWSSHKAYLRQEEIVWLTSEHLLKSFDENPTKALAQFSNFVRYDKEQETELNFDSGCREGILGNEAFVDSVLQKISNNGTEIELSDLIEIIHERYETTETSLSMPGKKYTHARAMLALLVREIQNLSIEELGRYLQKEPSSLSKLARRMEIKCVNSKTLLNELEELRKLTKTKSKMSECQA